MRLAKSVLGTATLIALTACYSGPTSYYVGGVQIDRAGQVTAVGPKSLYPPKSGGYYFFFHAARLTSVDHMERNPGASEAHRSLYLETRLNGRLDRTVKSDVLLRGDFGIIHTEKTCFYNRPVESNYSSVRIGFYSNAYASALENPVVLAGAPETGSALTSVSLIRIFRDGSAYTLVASDYEASGERRSFHVARANSGKLTPGTEELSFAVDGKDPRLEQYGIPSTLDINRYRASHHLPLRLPAPASEKETWVVEFYDFGKLIRQQQFRGGVAISSRWLRPSITAEERTIGPECDSRMSRQQAMGLPTTGY